MKNACLPQAGILDRESELLPVPYYHIVFTLPHAFNELLPHYDKEIYTALFAASWLTIQRFAADPKYLGAKTGMVSILHIPIRFASGQAMGAATLAPPSCSLCRAGRRNYSFRKMEKLQV